MTTKAQSSTAQSPTRSSLLSRAPISRRQVELVMSRSAAAFGLLFALQSLPGMLSGASHQDPLWNFIVVAGLFVSLAVSVVASLVG